MATISLCMIVKNEENVLERCLNNARHIADEIIIVDTGSTDKTKEIASKFTKKIYDFKWIDDFSAARNFAFSKATKDYQMWLDADDILPEESIQEISKLKNTLAEDVDIVTMKYVTAFDNFGNPSFTFARERLFKRSKNYKWHDPIHEVIPLVGNIVNSTIAIHHKKEDHARTKDRNINIYKGLEEKGHIFSPRQLYYYARELNDHGFSEKSAQYFEKFIKTEKGWIEDNIASAFTLSFLYETLDRKEEILPMLIQTFKWDAPRPEICCRIAYYYKNLKNYTYALKWFRIAYTLPEDKTILGFRQPDYSGYIPYIEASVCSYELGDITSAISYNENAAKYKETTAVKHNRDFFNSLTNL